ncbi:MAG: NRDE family protein [Leucothrix sp.]
MAIWSRVFLDIDSADTALAISQFTDCLQSSYKQYNPFNLLFGDARQLMIFSSSDGIARAVGDGVHSLSNGMPDDRWPKMQRGIEMLSNYLSEKPVISPDDIFSILTDKALPKPQLLPKTGVPFEAEYLLSSIYIPECSLNGMPYGTRSSSILWVKQGSPDDSVIMKSRSYQPTIY